MISAVRIGIIVVCDMSQSGFGVRLTILYGVRMRENFASENMSLVETSKAFWLFGSKSHCGCRVLAQGKAEAASAAAYTGSTRSEGRGHHRLTDSHLLSDIRVVKVHVN